jgi:uncharacterized membrane protein YhiD involved in acid resistance
MSERPYNFPDSVSFEEIVRFTLFALAALLLMTLMSSLVPQRQHTIGEAEDEHESEERMKIEKDMAKKANRERQVQLERDTNNLLKLATELKQSVEKSNENTLSLEVIKKAEEIEKLAHSVKEKMKAN